MNAELEARLRAIEARLLDLEAITGRLEGLERNQIRDAAHVSRRLIFHAERCTQLETELRTMGDHVATLERDVRTLKGKVDDLEHGPP